MQQIDMETIFRDIYKYFFINGINLRILANPYIAGIAEKHNIK